MDLIEKIGNSKFQHGKYNNRIYLLKYDQEDQNMLLPFLDDLANSQGYSKIIAKVPASAYPAFIQFGYSTEAYIPEFFNGNEGLFFMAKYPSTERSQITRDSAETFAKILTESPNKETRRQDHPFVPQIMSPAQVNEMAALYAEVFKSYPFPISDARYLEATMNDGLAIYFGIWHQNQLIALSSAELDRTNKNAEMTDFAVLPGYRGQNLAEILLTRMEEEMKKMQFKTLYTIARLQSPAMNKTFLRKGYHFSGLLKNNTNISGQIESMNIFYKTI